MVDTNDFITKALIFISAVGALILGLDKGLGFNPIQSFLPTYAKMVYYAVGGIGGYMLYKMFTDK